MDPTVAQIRTRQRREPTVMATRSFLYLPHGLHILFLISRKSFAAL
jgi:hypothetical protein